MILLLSTDLMASAPLSGVAARLGSRLVTSGALPGPGGPEGEPAFRLVILDLTTPGLEPTQVLREIEARGWRVPVIAFGPHVHAARLEAAKAAGCRAVFARGEFHARAFEIVARLLGSGGESAATAQADGVNVTAS